MARQLSYLGLCHESARDGQEGLNKWRAGNFDVLIVDCNMPLLNGYQLATKVREEERISDKPPCVILGYTANAQPEVRQKCLDAGMDDCLLKPIGLQLLGQRLASLTAGVQGNCCEQQAPHYDLEGLSAIVGDSISDRDRLVVTLHQSLIEDFATLMAIDPQQAPDALATQAHKILSAARMLEAKALIRACEALEQPGLRLDELKLGRQVLARQMRRVEKALARLLESPQRRLDPV